MQTCANAMQSLLGRNVPSILFWLMILSSCLKKTSEEFEILQSDSQDIEESAWSPWSTCSRTCEGGVTFRTKTCKRMQRYRLKHSVDGRGETRNHFESTGRHCQDEIREYRLCNDNPCPELISNFRRDQCKLLENEPFMRKYYKWEPYKESNENLHFTVSSTLGKGVCELNCQPLGLLFYKTVDNKVIDGTTCFISDPQWRCVAGKCEYFGCDGILDSPIHYDSCGICGGNGSECVVVSRKLSRSSKLGYNFVVRVPVGARQLKVIKNHEQKSFIAATYSNGTFILNGDGVIGLEGIYNAAGTQFYYSLTSKNNKEEIFVPGPLNNEIHILIYSTDYENELEYSYSLHKKTKRKYSNLKDAKHQPLVGHIISTIYSETNPSSKYKKLSGNTNTDDARARVDFTTTDVTTFLSGNRIRHDKTKTAVKEWKVDECDDSGQLTEMSIKSKSGIETDESQKSSTEPCKFPNSECHHCQGDECSIRWIHQGWSKCNSSCGKGIKYRLFACKQEVSPNVFVRVPRHLCRSEIPVETKVCQNRRCVRWKSEAWSRCSTACGGGFQQRRIRCYDSTTLQVLPSNQCTQESRPAVKRACNMDACSSGTWFHTEWTGECSNECGDLQHRKVVCLPLNIGTCTPNSKPEQSRLCLGNQSCSSGKWFTSSWSKCSVNCGHGIQTRDVICMHFVDDQYRPTSNAHCPADSKPASRQECNVFNCTTEWYMTEWSRVMKCKMCFVLTNVPQCSKTCGEGIEKRKLLCLDANLQNSTECNSELYTTVRICNFQDCQETDTHSISDKNFHYSMDPIFKLSNVVSFDSTQANVKNLSLETSKEPEENKLTKPSKNDLSCKNKLPNCDIVVRAGLCLSSYYGTSCCQTCSEASAKKYS